MEDGVLYRDTDLPLTRGDAAAAAAGDALAESLDRVTLAEHEIGLEKLHLLARYDEGRYWERDGARSMADWLCARYGLAKRTAMEWVRIAHALRRLPRIAEAYGAGRLSWDHVAAVTHLATPEDDELWAERAPMWRPRSLWLEVKRRRRLEREVLEEVRSTRSLQIWRDPVLPMFHLEGHLPAEEGAAVETALRRASKEIPRDSDARYPEEARTADALVAVLTRGSLRADGAASASGADDANVVPNGDETGARSARQIPMLVIHADATVLTREASGHHPALCETESGDRLPSEAVRRLACDARIDWVLERDGSPVRIGTRGRAVPERLRRTLMFRDRGCRFPGCEARRFVDAHHIVHWADGGPTTLENLVILCDAHHRLVHDGGWRISGHPDRELRFHDPSGRRLRTHPEPIARRGRPAPLRM